MRTPNFYAAPQFERAGLRRRDGPWIEARLADAASVFVPVWRTRNLFVGLSGAEPRAALLGAPALARYLAAEPPAARLARGEIVFLGIDDGRAHFALDLSRHENPLDALHPAADAIDRASLRFDDLRRFGPVIGRLDGALLAQARAMIHWHSRHRFCGVCGRPTLSEEAGHVRRCSDPACNTLHFPRTDPAVIMLVTRGERALLGRQKQFPPGMYSTLAGFVEPGESLEQAVAREVCEETAVEVDAVRYHSSQPWPFPGNIMLGFHAEARTSAITVDPGELEDARWFERDWLKAQGESSAFRLPRRDSIARRLVDDWLAETG
jgi:NAD+ diphosphatase